MSTKTEGTDIRHMMTALALARRGLGRVWPNPAVGCVVLDSDGAVAGRGWTQPGGRPHGETEALGRAGDAARNGSAYVSFEPCAHHGETPPCADALIEAGIARAVIATEDPDPRVSGAGIARLEKAGIEVVVGVGRRDAERLNAGFMKRVIEGRPLVTLKCATTLDGRIATHTGESQWITGEVARSWGHGLRACHDAVLTGATTVRADDPELTCRLQGMATFSPLRVVLDTRLTTPLTSKLVITAHDHPTWIMTLAGAEHGRKQAFLDCGVEVIEVAAGDGGRPDADAALGILAQRGVTRVLAEGGGRVVAALLRVGAVDRIAWFRAPGIIGGDGLPVAEAFGVDGLGQMAAFERRHSFFAGRDCLEIYERQAGVGRN
ncbi:MAG: bifunctional diaminohydroxyphosphoribosylaminopyrimidine deaminase/5-amino-6-(5-phosphoribosylamino)uracil reductase RibD [Alphaproteobacteria bacterium]